MNADKQMELDRGSGQVLGFYRRSPAYIGGCLYVLYCDEFQEASQKQFGTADKRGGINR